MDPGTVSINRRWENENMGAIYDVGFNSAVKKNEFGKQSESGKNLIK